MSGPVNRANQRLDKFRVNDEPHEDYYDCGVPILVSTAIGNVVETAVYLYTTSCPDCGTDGYYDEESEAVCPDCGAMLCDTSDIDMTTTDGQRIIADGPAAGRTDQPNTDY